MVDRLSDLERRFPNERFGITGNIISNLLSTVAICPLSEIVCIKEYLMDPEIACKRLDSKEVKAALDLRAAEINKWTISDYQKFYSNPTTKCIWSARSSDNVDDTYYSYSESLMICNGLLMYQMENSVDEFKKSLVSILESSVPRLNCMVIVSPPSAGKNFYFDGIRDYFMNAGQMNNSIGTYPFAYQDCCNKRIIFWNGPNYESSQLKKLKKLFAGDDLRFDVKYEPQAIVKRTPVIVLCNSEPAFVRHAEFRDSVVMYRWKAAPYLKDFDKKPLPTACVDILFNKDL
ncbi:uncharacterized protein LOC123319994 [Coccinella septempunctata]|uniref:uncharacterized protein LOC123319994 n=1 Tax=Coccinella septempunctata TaxID=41139 RepID=UPI001D08F0F8|nr:uncharacterized protein LOC123319994 [Coccinella septempunctata]